MTDLRQAAEQALKALEWSNEYLEIICAKLFPKSKKTQPGSMVWHLNKAITALRAALAEPVNFCPRCGKRAYPDTVHTCTPPNDTPR